MALELSEPRIGIEVVVEVEAVEIETLMPLPIQEVMRQMMGVWQGLKFLQPKMFVRFAMTAQTFWRPLGRRASSHWAEQSRLKLL